MNANQNVIFFHSSEYSLGLVIGDFIILKDLTQAYLKTVTSLGPWRSTTVAPLDQMGQSKGTRVIAITRVSSRWILRPKTERERIFTENTCSSISYLHFPFRKRLGRSLFRVPKKA